MKSIYTLFIFVFILCTCSKPTVTVAAFGDSITAHKQSYAKQLVAPYLQVDVNAEGGASIEYIGSMMMTTGYPYDYYIIFGE